MILPESAPMQEKDYPYLNHANAMWKRLGMIKNGAIEYCSDDYAALANTLERFYKGFLQIQMDLNSEMLFCLICEKHILRHDIL